MRYRAMLAASLVVAIGLGAAVPATAAPKPDDRPSVKKKDKRKRRPALRTGEVAPVFKLDLLDSDKKVDLKQFQGKRPVILFFGSYT